MRSCLVVIGVVVVCGVVGVAALVFLGSLVGDIPDGAQSAPKTPEPPKEEMVADVRIASGQLLVTVVNSYDWRNCRVTVNDDWKVTGIRFPTREPSAVPLADFTKRDGERFSPFRYRPQGVYFHCTTPHGRDGIGYNW